METLPTHLPNVAEDAFATVETAARQNRVKLETCIAPELEGWMLTDPNRCTQILINLCSNAVKFTSDGTVTIDASLRTAGETTWVDIAVIDTGIGMTEDAMATLFDPFTQASAATARSSSPSARST